MPVIIACDPGVAPTLCVLIDDPGKPLAAEFYEDDDVSYQTVVGGVKRRRPSAPLLRQAFKQSLATLCVIEDVHSMPGQGVASTFIFGFAAGLLEGVASALQIPVLRVTAKTWKAAFRIPVGAKKAMSRHVACNVAPHLAESFARSMDHNRAEAFLMAYWARGHRDQAR